MRLTARNKEKKTKHSSFIPNSSSQQIVFLRSPNYLLVYIFLISKGKTVKVYPNCNRNILWYTERRIILSENCIFMKLHITAAPWIWVEYIKKINIKSTCSLIPKRAFNPKVASSMISTTVYVFSMKCAHIDKNGNYKSSVLKT